MTDTIITILSLATIFAQIGLVLAIILLFTKRKLLVNDFISTHLNLAIFIVALTATSGSLFFSQIALFEPCELCWFQRIFMYPLAILFGIAWYRKENIIYKYALPLVVIGWLISLYHNYIYYQGVSSTVCSLESATSCIIPYFTKFGYIGIPIMSLTAFSLIGFLFILFRLNHKSALSD